MAEWRLGRTWSRAELEPRLAAAARLLPSAPEEPLTPETGWNRSQSHAVVAFEEPGPPGRTFERARQLMGKMGYSDPRIVVGHWTEGAPLPGRTVLLELKSMGLHFLCPVRVGAVRDEQPGIYGFRFDTLQGHIERGREWFLLTKEQQTGEISFRIDAGWLPGEFPNWWSEAGFHFLGPRYQRAWHRLAHQHLREALRDWDGKERQARGHAVAHPAVSAPVQWVAQKAARPAGMHKEREEYAR